MGGGGGGGEEKEPSSKNQSVDLKKKGRQIFSKIFWKSAPLLKILDPPLVMAQIVPLI